MCINIQSSLKNAQLMVEEITGDLGDNSAVYVSPIKIKELELLRGDTVLVKGKKKNKIQFVL